MCPLLVCLIALIGSAVADVAGDNSKPTPQIIEDDGFTAETHRVTTEDCYNLEMHRIPGAGPPVLVMHGLLGSSADWCIPGPGKALAYLLAILGYDVWLGNFRGNTYSKNQSNMTCSTKGGYWEFSWHEMGYHDLATMIDYVLVTTGKEKLTYVGFSQGTTACLVLTSTRPEYNAKIISAHLMAPIAYMRHATHPLFKLLSQSGFASVLGSADGCEFLSNSAIITFLGRYFCEGGDVTLPLCSNLFTAIFGVRAEQVNETNLPVIMGHCPAGASTRNFLHYFQSGHSGYFRYYDYDILSNLWIYGSLSPPDYDLSKITVPIYCYWSAGDTLSAGEDVDQMMSEIQNPMKKTIISDLNYQHVEFVCGKDANSLVYAPVIADINSLQ